MPDAIIVLCGTKIDFRDSTTHVSHEQGQALKKEIGVHAYIEASAITQEGLRQVFDEVARVTFASKAKNAAVLAKRMKQKRRPFAACRAALSMLAVH